MKKLVQGAHKRQTPPQSRIHIIIHTNYNYKKVNESRLGML